MTRVHTMSLIERHVSCHSRCCRIPRNQEMLTRVGYRHRNQAIPKAIDPQCKLSKCFQLEIRVDPAVLFQVANLVNNSFQSDKVHRLILLQFASSHSVPRAERLHRKLHNTIWNHFYAPGGAEQAHPVCQRQPLEALKSKQVPSSWRKNRQHLIQQYLLRGDHQGHTYLASWIERNSSFVFCLWSHRVCNRGCMCLSGSPAVPLQESTCPATH
mmetsp:Transcript_115443/g.182482  ORF Transcript_115443/g.182482 Transcript_115443/m.182482 type:complete len:213 (-) Transcript_115443:407-1045(-)